LSGDDSYERQYLASRGYRQFAAKATSSSETQDPVAVASFPGAPAPPLPDRAERPIAVAARPDEQAADVAMLDWDTQLKASPESTGSTGPLVQTQPRQIGPADGPAIQAGSFKNRDNAERARATLSAIAPVNVAEVDVGGELYFRVRVGPFADEIEAVAALPRVRAAGYDGAKIVMRN
jgi:rare lipoprotein A